MLHQRHRDSGSKRREAGGLRTRPPLLEIEMFVLCSPCRPRSVFCLEKRVLLRAFGGEATVVVGVDAGGVALTCGAHGVQRTLSIVVDRETTCN